VQGRAEVVSQNGLMVYRLAREGLSVEAWYRNDARRTPVKVVFGRDFGRIEATLIEGR
jgi:hypothetical protein